jgi:acetolactate synthase-1/2/3 large subunit
MNGAEALITTLADCGLTACFANPGTSEMHIVSALDREPRIRSILCLFEGVATGAADGFARIAGKPAVSLLHLGPGFLNGGANLHNAKRAFTPTLTVIGDHASAHLPNDPPLASDIAAMAGPLAAWLGTAEDASQIGAEAAKAFAASFGPPGGGAVLIVRNDAAWGEGGSAAAPVAPRPRAAVNEKAIADAAKALRGGKRPIALIGGNALVEPGLSGAARLEAAGVKVFCDTFFARADRGAGLFAPERLAYFAEMALEQTAGADVMAIIGARAPAAFFAYPGRTNALMPEGCASVHLGGPESEAATTVAALADALGAPKAGPTVARSAPDVLPGPLNAYGLGAALARRMPADAIFVDDGITNAVSVYALTAGAARHSWLCNVGGAIGSGMPNAIGAAVAAPARKVICLTGDGSALYTVQALWTMARENLDVLTIVCANRAYRILSLEMARGAAAPLTPETAGLLSLENPVIDWVKLAEAQGVPAMRCDTSEGFDAALAEMLTHAGPKLIEAVVV